MPVPRGRVPPSFPRSCGIQASAPSRCCCEGKPSPFGSFRRFSRPWVLLLALSIPSESVPSDGPRCGCHIPVDRITAAVLGDFHSSCPGAGVNAEPRCWGMIKP